MPKYQCKACGGRYQSPQGDEEYFHVCPPLPDGSKRLGHRDENVEGLKDSAGKALMEDDPVKRQGIDHWLQKTRVKSEGAGREEQRER